MVKFYQYFLSSILLSMGMIAYACYTREQFYPIILLLVTSKVSFVIGANMVLALFILSGKVGIKLFFKELRDAEIEVIRERAKYSMTETLLALTIFRYELTPTVFLFFGILVFCKIFHWISRSRLDYLEQVARVTLYAHFTLLLAIVFMLACCVTISYCCVLYSIEEGKTVIILFAFEFGVLVLASISNFVRYVINIIDGYYENGLLYKGLYFMILDLICDGLRFCTYCGFFCIVFVYYGLPIHIVRDVYMAFISFFLRLTSFVRYMKLTRNLDERLEDASPEDLAAHEEGGCLICRESIESGKKLSCGHVFHLNCLRTWLQHQQTCPLCRAEIEISASGEGSERQRREQRALAAAVAAAERAREQGGQGQGQVGGDEFLRQQVLGAAEEEVQQPLPLAEENNIQREEDRMQRQEPIGQEQAQPDMHQQQHANVVLPGVSESRREPKHQSRNSCLLPQVASSAQSSSLTASSRLLANSVSDSKQKLSSSFEPYSHRHASPFNKIMTPSDTPGFFSVCGTSAVIVHKSPSLSAHVIRALPVGLIVFVEGRLVVEHRQHNLKQQLWLKIPDGWVLSDDGEEVRLQPYEEKSTTKVMPKNSSRGVHSTVSNTSGAPMRARRILRMQQEMSRLQANLTAITSSMERLNCELNESLLEEIELQKAAPAAMTDITKSTPSNGASSDVSEDVNIFKRNSTTETMSQQSPSQTNVKVEKEKSDLKFSKSSSSNIENQKPDDPPTIPVAMRSASTPSRLPGSKKSSPFGYLTQSPESKARNYTSTTPSSTSKSPGEIRHALPRDINDDKKSPPKSTLSIDDEFSRLTDNDAPKLEKSASTPASSRQSNTASDVRQLRAMYFASGSSTKDSKVEDDDDVN